MTINRWTPRTAQWIWLPGEEKPKNGYVLFRKTFVVDSPVPQVTVHVSADCKYLLYLNGGGVGRGPVVTLPQYKQIDSYDVSSLVRPGKNTLTARVLQRHTPTMRLYPVRGGFLAELASPERVLAATDATWKARWATEYDFDAPLMTRQYGQQEWYDARRAPLGWEEADFDDSQWGSALPVPNAAQFWAEALEIRRLPHNRRVVAHPVAVVTFFGLSSWGTTGGKAELLESENPAVAIERGYPMSSVVAEGLDNLLHPEQGPAVFIERQGDGVGLVLDLGTEMYGHPFFDIECPAGAVVNIGHGEILSRNRIQTVLLPGSPAAQHYADRYVARAGRQRFEIFDFKGCRYLEIHFHRLADFYTGAKVTIHEIGFVHSETPIEQKSTFDCPDQRLNRVWEICGRTADVLQQDLFINDALREHCQYADLGIAKLYLQRYGRSELVHHVIEIFTRTILPSGFLICHWPMALAPDRPPLEKEMYFCPTLTLPMVVYLNWLYQGPDERLDEWLDVCVKIIAGISKYVGPHGTLTNLPGDPWFEWSAADIRKAGRDTKVSAEVTVWNALWPLALDAIAVVAESRGRDNDATAWRKEAMRLRQATDARFWSEPHQAYIDGVYDGTPSVVVSRATNALALLARLGDPQRQQRAAAVVENPGTHVMPTTMLIGLSYCQEALESVHRDGAVLAEIRRIWGRMIDFGATTTWEGENALEMHQDLCIPGACPLNYIVRTLLGVVPLEPGYRLFSVRVAPADLMKSQGRIATPRGYIDVEWHRRPGRFEMDLTVPEESTAHVAPPRFAGADRPVRQARLDGRDAALAPQAVALCSFLREDSPALAVGSGHHRIEFDTEG